MEAHHRKNHHELPPTRLTSSEGDQVPDQTEQVNHRRTSFDQASDHSLAAHLSELMTTIYSLSNIRHAAASVQVQPVSSISRKSSLKAKLSRVRSSIRVVYFKECFYEVYGTLGLVMLLAFTLSFLAMVYMTVAQVMPNWMANFLMGTASLDKGEFLLMSKPSQAIVVTSALMLSVFACLYLWLIVFMLSYNSETTVNNLAQAPNPKSLSYHVMQKLLPLLKRIQAQTRRTPYQTPAAVVTTPPKKRSFENLGMKVNRSSLSSSQTPRPRRLARVLRHLAHVRPAS